MYALKSIALALLLTFSSLAFAANLGPVKLSGLYTYSDVPELLQTLEVRVVRLYRAEDHEELKRLKQDGFHCGRVDSKTSRCARILTQAPLPEKVEKRIAARFKGASVEFGAESSDPQVLFEGDDIIEYLVSQPMRVMKEHYENYRYFIGGDLHKLQTGENIPSDFSFVVDHESRFNLIQSFSAALPNGFYRYLVALPFQK